MVAAVSFQSPITSRVPILCKQAFVLRKNIIFQCGSRKWRTVDSNVRLQSKLTAHSTSSAAFFLATEPPAASGDYSVLLITGGLMFFVYWIANFIVPQMITKDLSSENADSDSKIEADQK